MRDRASRTEFRALRSVGELPAGVVGIGRRRIVHGIVTPQSPQ
jgi:hypothetical protein